MEKKLISMTDFIEQEHDKLTIGISDWPEVSNFRKSCVNYAKFLKQRLTLGMFVPCYLNGDVFELVPKDQISNPEHYDNYITDYQKAKERVLFANVSLGDFGSKGGFVLFVGNYELALKTEGGISWKEDNIEGLVDTSHIELTPTALKQIGL